MIDLANTINRADREEAPPLTAVSTNSADSAVRPNADANSDAADVDMAVLLGFEEAQCEDEPDLIVELIDLYLDDVPEQLSAMRNFVSQADEESLKRAAHTLKGSSSNLGVNAVAALCREIEKTDSSQSAQALNELIDRLERAVERARRILSDERQKRV